MSIWQMVSQYNGGHDLKYTEFSQQITIESSIDANAMVTDARASPALLRVDRYAIRVFHVSHHNRSSLATQAIAGDDRMVECTVVEAFITK